MADRFIEITSEQRSDGTARFAVYVVDKLVGRVRLDGDLTHGEALELARAGQEDFGAIIDRTRG